MLPTSFPSLMTKIREFPTRVLMPRFSHPNQIDGPRSLPQRIPIMKLCRLSLAASLFFMAAISDAEPLQVFILAGQSNMQGHAQVRTFEHIGMDPATKPMLAEMQNADGSPRVLDRVWISSIGCADSEQTGKLTTGFGASQNGPKIGPEYTFGITIQKFVKGPILLIKTSWGGKSLNTDFRPPSAGPYVFNETQLGNFQKQGKDITAITAEKEKATGVYYRLMVEHVKSVLADIKRVVPSYDASQGYELAGFVWFQGWNDMVDSGTYPKRDMPGGYDAYSHTMAHFIRDVRKDLKAPKLPFVIGVLGVGGPTSEYGPDQQRYKPTHDNFRAAMAAPAELPEFKGNVARVLTEQYWDRELTAAKAKENEIKQKAKKLATDGKMKPAEERSLHEKLRSEGLTERERLILEKGISNLEFHYLGSAKILGGIGKGLAEAVAELKQLEKTND
jgi:Carbohydrate esterase, sialic acid-specific acetylesterase